MTGPEKNRARAAQRREDIAKAKAIMAGTDPEYLQALRDEETGPYVWVTHAAHLRKWARHTIEEARERFIRHSRSNRRGVNESFGSTPIDHLHEAVSSLEAEIAWQREVKR